ncbi:MAG: hypothetical protein IJ936_08220 [Peptococcaceae bacterium]|nr:hypothetical protein [Peptococcaceae bacterium]
MLSRRIVDVVGRQILDSRGTPTLEAEVALENGIVGRAAVPLLRVRILILSSGRLRSFPVHSCC